MAIDDVTVTKQEENCEGVRKTKRGKGKYVHNML
jgi:hypothetical protein